MSRVASLEALPPQSPPVDDLLRQRLLRLAEPLRASTREEAAGRCLALSLEVAQLAHAGLGVQLRLLRWPVRNDPDFVEHWAVELGPDHALDPTHLQVHGQPELLANVASYPVNFLPCRRYPAAPLLALYRRPDSTSGERMTSRFLVACSLHILRHDMHLAWQRRSAGCALDALGQAWTFASVFALNCLTRRLEARAGRLIARLHPQAEVAARSVGVQPAAAAQANVTAQHPASAASDALATGRQALNRRA